MAVASTETPEPTEPGNKQFGLGALVVLCVLSLCLAMVISELVERRMVVPACKGYAAEHGVAFKGVDVYSLRQDDPGAHCLFRQADGSESVVWLQRVVPLRTDFWVSLVIDIEISTPVLWVLTSLAWMSLRRRWPGQRR